MEIVSNYNNTDDRFELDEDEWKMVGEAGEAIIQCQPKMKSYTKDFLKSIMAYAEQTSPPSVSEKQLKFINDQLRLNGYDELAVNGTPTPVGQPPYAWHAQNATNGVLSSVVSKLSRPTIPGTPIDAANDNRIEHIERELRTLTLLVHKLFEDKNG